MLPLSSASSSASATSRIPRSRSSRAIAELASSSDGGRLEILAPDLARDLERLRVPALVVVEVAEPPADPRAGGERLDPVLGRRVVEEDERLLDELAAAGKIGVAHEGVLGERGQREALEADVAGVGRVGEDALHLDRLRRQIGEPACGAGREEAALERRLELDGADEQTPCSLVRLLRQSAAARLLERRPPRAWRAPRAPRRRAPPAASPRGRGGRRGSRRALRPRPRAASRRPAGAARRGRPSRDPRRRRRGSGRA